VSVIRSERVAAIILLTAAILALVLANTAAGPVLLDLQHAELGPLSVGHWISDGLLAFFFFSAAIELKHELTHGELDSVSKALRPAIAAVCGVAVPALVYFALAGPAGYGDGWPIPTATDIAFALGVLALVGRGIPSRIRVFLLALAIIDDIIAIVIIAIFFTTSLDVGALLGSVVAVAAFGALSYVRGRFRIAAAIAMVLLAIVAWWLMYSSGVHATIAGVLLGLAMRGGAGTATRYSIEPIINGVVLPLFAFSAALVAIPSVGLSELAPPFWAIIIALPVGKIIGIGIGGWIGSAVSQRTTTPAISTFALLAVGALGGIGFTVSLLMNELAFASDDTIRAEGTLAVLIGSGISIVLSLVLVSALARRFRAGRLA
jgi:NhaA family Na+:H+ antiporter